MNVIEIGNLTIIERAYANHTHEGLIAYDLCLTGEARGRRVYVSDVREAVLYGLEYQEFGLNSQWAKFACKMLGLDGKVWVGTGDPVTI